eukprot:CAMPEP_0204208044 /NCGR_PEP_ID=MMETSP0361-20130328/72195_1 /ASSEMBLY_ACC=CAM_ASM_000343 /TAXON_ID=268821 /ORGANISM="Scrippsiella Hangoei, Strain SHTV-5" /LENGTH=300 /DNA_ID=CAMNT_0051171739 /DNA_START=81 /DNA_END=981 /DNA_ORIENTATION=+
MAAAETDHNTPPCNFRGIARSPCSKSLHGQRRQFSPRGAAGQIRQTHRSVPTHLHLTPPTSTPGAHPNPPTAETLWHGLQELALASPLVAGCTPALGADLVDHHAHPGVVVAQQQGRRLHRAHQRRGDDELGGAEGLACDGRSCSMGLLTTDLGEMVVRVHHQSLVDVVPRLRVAHEGDPARGGGDSLRGLKALALGCPRNGCLDGARELDKEHLDDARRRVETKARVGSHHGPTAQLDALDDNVRAQVANASPNLPRMLFSAIPRALDFRPIVGRGQRELAALLAPHNRDLPLRGLGRG